MKMRQGAEIPDSLLMEIGKANEAARVTIISLKDLDAMLSHGTHDRRESKRRGRVWGSAERLARNFIGSWSAK